MVHTVGLLRCIIALWLFILVPLSSSQAKVQRTNQCQAHVNYALFATRGKPGLNHSLQVFFHSENKIYESF